MFRILYVETGEYASADIFSDAKAASEAATKIKNETGRRTRIKREVTSDAWRVREASRMLDGTYKPLPDWWQSADWWRGSVASADHFAHVASDGKRIAYTQSPEKGEEDKQTVIPASTYLARYFGNVLRSEQISAIAGALGGEAFALHIASDAETFEKVYEGISGTGSCMGRSRGYYGTSRHPAAVYGAGDLQIAWLVPPGADKFTGGTARAIVYPKREGYIRIYSQTAESEATLARLLNEAGFKRIDSLAGARLLKIEEDSGDYVMPYLDGAAQSVDDEGEHWIVRRGGEHDASSTGGTLRMGGRYTCDRCGDSMHEEDCHHISGEMWCESCYEDNAMFCERYEESFPADEAVTVNVGRGRQQTWCEDAARNYAFQDDIDGEWWSKDYYTEIEVYTARGLETWCAEEHEDYFSCENSGNEYSCEDFTSIEVNTSNGREVWCKEETEGEWFLCEDCGEYFANDQRHCLEDGAAGLFPAGDICADCCEAREEAEEAGLPIFVAGSGRIEDARQLEMLL